MSKRALLLPPSIVICLFFNVVAHYNSCFRVCDRFEPDLLKSWNESSVNERVLLLFFAFARVSFYDGGALFLSMVDGGLKKLRRNAFSSERFGHEEADDRPHWFFIDFFQRPRPFQSSIFFSWRHGTPADRLTVRIGEDSRS